MIKPNKGARALRLEADKRGIRGAARHAGVSVSTFWHHVRGESLPLYPTRMLYAKKLKVPARWFDEPVEPVEVVW